jgi:hypothetical protein
MVCRVKGKGSKPPKRGEKKPLFQQSGGVECAGRPSAASKPPLVRERERACKLCCCFASRSPRRRARARSGWRRGYALRLRLVACRRVAGRGASWRLDGPREGRRGRLPSTCSSESPPIVVPARAVAGRARSRWSRAQRPVLAGWGNERVARAAVGADGGGRGSGDRGWVPMMLGSGWGERGGERERESKGGGGALVLPR